jgi:hypothetical protein
MASSHRRRRGAEGALGHQGQGRKHPPAPPLEITGVPFFNLSKFTLAKPAEGSGLNGLLDDPNQLAPNLNSYINGFSPNVRAIIEKFKVPVPKSWRETRDRRS